MLDKLTKKILSSPEMLAWPDLEPILTKRKPGTIALFNIAYESTGNTDIDTLPIQAAIVCFIINCILIDDILDEDEKGVWQQYGTGRVANLAAALHARQQILIHESAFSADQKQALMFQLNQMKLLEAQAQEMATTNQLNLDRYWTIVHGKSGNVCGTAMKMGALLGEANPEQVELLYAIGKNMGEVGQISNDLRGAFQKQVNPDWTMTGSSLPILLALTSDHADLDELNSIICKDLSQNDRLKRAQEILVHCGAVSACCDQITQKLSQMYDDLSRCDLNNKAHLHQKIGEDIQHASNWLKALDIDLSETTAQTLSALELNLKSLLS